MKRIFVYQDQERGRALLRRFKRQQQAAMWNFVNNPGIAPIPTPAAWTYSGFTQTATLANSSTAVTALSIGTTMLAVGQVVTGAGIVNNPPTTIAALGAATSGNLTLSQNTTSSAAGTLISLTFQGVPGLQTSQFSQYPFFAVPSASAADVAGQTYYIPETQTLLAGANFVPANGWGILALTSGTTAMNLQFQTGPVGTWTTFYSGTVSVTTYLPGEYHLDGTNVRINCPTTNGSFTFYRLRNPTTY